MLRQCLTRNTTQPRGGFSRLRDAVLRRPVSSSSRPSPDDKDSKTPSENDQAPTTSKPKKTMADLDEEMKRAMENLAGDGGESGAELEDGKPVSMKRGVRENMFRYI